MTDAKETRIREARRRAGLTAEGAAQRFGCSLGWWRTIERAPWLAGPELVARIAAELGVDPRSLAGRIGAARGVSSRRMVF